jgi:hypothetical protein
VWQHAHDRQSAKIENTASRYMQQLPTPGFTVRGRIKALTAENTEHAE